MTTERNKAAMARMYDEIWKQKNLDNFDSIYAETIVDHYPPPGLPAVGREPHRVMIQAVLGAFPDATFEVVAIVGEGDRVVGHWVMDATHSGAMMGMPPTGKRVHMIGFDLATFNEAGEIAELWHLEDQFSLFKQLGIITPPGRPRP